MKFERTGGSGDRGEGVREREKSQLTWLENTTRRSRSVPEIH